ncbi:MAG: hypothetical protein IT431_04525 [Phycisphaerales bacterium]|nr:hypothetical protein [Phycisphaerales bacterium]
MRHPHPRTNAAPHTPPAASARARVPWGPLLAAACLAAVASPALGAELTAPGPTLLSNLPRFLGRTHPIAVHFPIALLAAAVLFELVAILCKRDRARPTSAGLACVIVGALGAAVAAWAGWLNADLETHSKGLADLMTTHRWLGIAAAALAAVAMLAALLGATGRARAMTAVYRVALVLAAGVVGAAGHWGGSMVYGEGYLTAALFPAPAPAAPDLDAQQAELAALQAQLEASGKSLTIDFATQIAPIFANHCIECHGPDKQKGDLRLDARQFVFDDRAPDAQVIIPGDAQASDLFFLVTLPEDDEDHMPPEGKGEPLSPDQLALLETWINEGALWLDIPIVAPAATADAAPAEPNQPDHPARPALPELVFDEAAQAQQADAFAALHARGVVALRASQADPWAEVRFDLLGHNITDADLALLEPLKPTLTRLNLAGTAVTDAALAALCQFPRLAELNLSRTAVTDAGVARLTGHPALRSLNLYSTAVTDQTLVAAASLPALENLYLWNTRVAPQSAQLLAALKPGLTVDCGGELTPVSFDDIPAPTDQPGAEPAADTTPDIDLAALPDCCRAAIEAGGECDHPCCVEARAKGEICQKCLGN